MTNQDQNKIWAEEIKNQYGYNFNFTIPSLPTLTVEMKDKLGLNLVVGDEETLPLTYKFAGTASGVPGFQNCSSQRQTMSYNADKSAMPLDNPDVPIVGTGFMASLADFAYKTIVPVDGTILSIHWKNHNIGRIAIKGYDNRVHLVEIKNFFYSHEKFGFKLDFTDLLKNLKVGQQVVAGDVLADNIQSRRGIETNTRNLIQFYGTFNEGEEDSALISDVAAELLSSVTYYKMELVINQDDLFINSYGDRENYQPIPAVGQALRQDALVMAKRDMSRLMFVPILLDEESIMDFDEDFDKAVYGPEGETEVVDITVIDASGSKLNKFPETVKFVNKLRDEFDDYNRKLIDLYYNKIRKQRLSVADTFANHLNKSYALALAKNLSFRGERLNGIRIELVIKKKVKPSIRSKISGRLGNKCIVCGIFPEKDMPRLADGTYAHMVTGVTTVSNRNNSPIITLGDLGMMCRQFRGDCRRLYGKDIHDGDLTEEYFRSRGKELRDTVFKKALEFLELMMSPLFETYSNATDEQIDYIVYEILSDEFRVIIPEPHISQVEFLTRIQNSKYGLRRMSITSNLQGDMVTLEEEGSFTVQEILLQNKLGDRVMSCTIPFESHYELPISLSAKNRDSRQVNYAAVGMYGRTELRTLQSYVKQEAFAEMIDLCKSPNTRNHAYLTILKADQPTNITKIVDRDIVPFGDDPYTKHYQSITKCAGYEPVYRDGGRLEDDKYSEDVLTSLFKSNTIFKGE